MNRICFLYPYFGRFNDFFELFLASASYNSNIDFHFYTDAVNCQIYSGRYANVYFHEDSLCGIKQRLSCALGIDCLLNNPYKLCDYKPFYNLIFKEHKNYDFWGFGDVDVILGSLSQFLTSDVLENNIVVGKLGHLCLVKNDTSITSMFLKKNQEEILKVCSTDQNCGFDERDFSYFRTIRNFFPNKVFDIDDCISDIRPQYAKLSRHKFTNKPERKTLNAVHFFSYKDGHLFALRKNDNPFEIMYIHFQKRPMKVKTHSYEAFLIVPNLFLPYKGTPYFWMARFRVFEFIRHQIYWIKKYLKKLF